MENVSAFVKKPHIQTNYTKLEDISNDSLQALVQANNPPTIFVMGGHLVRIRQDEKGYPIIDRINDDILCHELERAAEYYKRGTNSDTPIAPPLNVLKDIQAMPEWPGIPSLQGIVQAPVVKPNGDILDKPGYDLETHLYYLPSPDLKIPPIPLLPDVDDVEKAKDLLKEVIIDFPFATEADFTNMVALILTPFVRPTIQGPVPMAIISAPQIGSGKSTLGKVCGLIATGHGPHMVQYSQSEEENRKKITSALLKGNTVIEFDNVRRIIDSEALASALTSTEWSDRLLGRSESVCFPQEATWIANGNNLRIGNEFVRRSYPINLTPEDNHPWTHNDYLHPILDIWVLENRGDLIWAILVLVRYWALTGKPRFEDIALGNFTEWVAIIGGILMAAGYNHFLENLDDMYEVQGEEEAQWELFLTFLSEHFKYDWFKTDELCQILQDDSFLVDCLPDEIAEIWVEDQEPTLAQKRQIGKIFKRISERKFGDSGIFLETSKDKHKKVTQWRVSCGDAGYSGVPDCQNK